MKPSTLVRLSALAGLAFASVSAQAVISTFDTGTEGWTAQGDVEHPIEWSATGGNPGGHVVIDDRTVGGVTYFVAPAAFLGNKSAALGTNLTFDIMQVYPGSPNQFDSSDVMLQGGGTTLVYNAGSNPPNNVWTSYAVPLSAPGWKVNALDGAAATTEQFAAVMGNLSALKIRAEFQTGSDFGHLDNVALVPEPETWAMLLAGLVGVGFAAGRGRSRR